MSHSAKIMFGTHDNHDTMKYVVVKSPRVATVSNGSQIRSVTAPKMRL